MCNPGILLCSPSTTSQPFVPVSREGYTCLPVGGALPIRVRRSLRESVAILRGIIKSRLVSFLSLPIVPRLEFSLRKFNSCGTLPVFIAPDFDTRIPRGISISLEACQALIAFYIRCRGLLIMSIFRLLILSLYFEKRNCFNAYFIILNVRLEERDFPVLFFEFSE